MILSILSLRDKTKFPGNPCFVLWDCLNLNCTISKYCETVKEVSEYSEENIQKSGQFPHTLGHLNNISN